MYKIIDSMKYMDKSSLFGNEKDESFKGSIGAIYQSLDGKICIRHWRKKQQTYCILQQRL